MRSSDCSSDLCSSDLSVPSGIALLQVRAGDAELPAFPFSGSKSLPGVASKLPGMRTPVHVYRLLLFTPLPVSAPCNLLLCSRIHQIGRASCRERVCKYV